MRRIELARRVTPDAALALWHEVESGFEAASDGGALGADGGPDARRGLHIDAGAVQYLSAAGLQVLLVAATKLRAEGAYFEIGAASAAFELALAQMGAADLLAEGAQ